MWGEPHLSTFDKVRFDLQAAGEFVAAKSLDDSLEVQMRLEPWSPRGWLSIATAVAARVGKHRVTITAGSDTSLRVDGRPIEIPDAHYRIIRDAAASIVRTGRRYSVVWPDGTNLHVDQIGNHLNLYLLPAEPRDGRLVGILGNADGDEGGNDFRTRGGRALASPPQFETLYKVFAESWRVTGATSLFDYRPGESTTTFTNRDLPIRRVTVDDVAQADRLSAEQRCRAAGVTEPLALQECVFDFALTGDEQFIASARSRQPPPEFLSADTATAASAALGITPRGDAKIEAPAEAIASFPIDVKVHGPASGGDLVCIAPAASGDRERCASDVAPADGNAGETQTVTLPVPNHSGAYQLRYIVRQPDWSVSARLPLKVRDPVASIEAPAAAPAFGDVKVSCVGECSPLNYLTVVPVGSPDDQLGPHAYLDNGPNVSILYLPKQPGAYEVRLLAHPAPRRVFARRPIRIE